MDPERTLIVAHHFRRVGTALLCFGVVGLFLTFDYVTSGLSIATGVTVASAVRNRINNQSGTVCCGCSIKCLVSTLIAFAAIGVLWSGVAVVAIGAQAGGTKGSTYAYLLLTLIFNLVRLGLAIRVLTSYGVVESWLVVPQAAPQPSVVVIQMPTPMQQPVYYNPPPVFYAPQQQLEVHHHHHHHSQQQVHYVNTNQYFGHQSLQPGASTTSAGSAQGPISCVQPHDGVSINPLLKTATIADDPNPDAATLSQDSSPTPKPSSSVTKPQQQRSRPPEGVQRVIVRKVFTSFEAQGPKLARLSPGVSAAPVSNAELLRATRLIASAKSSSTGRGATQAVPHTVLSPQVSASQGSGDTLGVPASAHVGVPTTGPASSDPDSHHA